jgi:hypothetical protein
VTTKVQGVRFSVWLLYTGLNVNLGGSKTTKLDVLDNFMQRKLLLE